MRRLLLMCVLALSPAAARAQAADQLFTATKEQLAVTHILLAQEAAWNKGDLEAYLALYKAAPDTVALLDRSTRGIENIRATMRTTFPTAKQMGTLEQSEVEVRELGPDFALATGHYALLRPAKLGGEAHGTFTDVLERTPEGWRIIYSAVQ